MKRISFNHSDAHHLYELALEHFCVYKYDGDCYQCGNLKKRLEKFLGKKDVRYVKRIVKKNGYCDHIVNVERKGKGKNKRI